MAGRLSDLARPEYPGLRIPTLEEVFARYGTRVNYYVETKETPGAPLMEEELLRLMDRYGLTAPAASRWQVLIQSFHPDSLNEIHLRVGSHAVGGLSRRRLDRAGHPGLPAPLLRGEAGSSDQDEPIFPVADTVLPLRGSPSNAQVTELRLEAGGVLFAGTMGTGSNDWNRRRSRLPSRGPEQRLHRTWR